MSGELEDTYVTSFSEQELSESRRPMRVGEINDENRGDITLGRQAAFGSARAERPFCPCVGRWRGRDKLRTRRGAADMPELPTAAGGPRAARRRGWGYGAM
jgi:hypothetical protein